MIEVENGSLQRAGCELDLQLYRPAEVDILRAWVQGVDEWRDRNKLAQDPQILKLECIR